MQNGRDMQHGYVHVHAACPCKWCMSMSSACAYPCCMSVSISVLQVLSRVHVRVRATCLCLCSNSMSKVHVHVHAACLRICCISVSIVHFQPAFCLCCMPTSILHKHVLDACPCSFLYLRDCMSISVSAYPCPWCISMFMLHVHVYASYPCQCCMFMSMLHVHVKCCMSMSILPMLALVYSMPMPSHVSFYRIVWTNNWEIMARKTRCQSSKPLTKKPILGRVWSIARDKEVTSNMCN